MELPAALRAAVDKALEGVPLADLQAAAERLSARYRSETRDGRAHLSDDLSARAYLAVRMPATYAAIRASLDAVANCGRISRRKVCSMPVPGRARRCSPRAIAGRDFRTRH